jgi:hypothetical protein
MDPRVLYSVQSAVLFFLIAAPFTYKVVQAIFGKLFTVAVNGAPTYAGVVLHSVVYGILVYLLMVVQGPKVKEAFAGAPSPASKAPAPKASTPKAPM